MFKIAICDDEEYFRDVIKNHIIKLLIMHEINEYKIDSFQSGEEFFSQTWVENRYQVVFLDISMPGITGMEAARKIRERDEDLFIVFITAFIDYAVEGYQVNAVRFILKDMLASMLPECLDTIIKKLKLKKRKIKYTFLQGRKEIFIDNILYIESNRHKIMFHLIPQGEVIYTLYEKLDNIELELNEKSFLRIHKSYLVNMKYIEAFFKYRVRLSNGEELSVPKQKYSLMEEEYYEYRGDLL